MQFQLFQPKSLLLGLTFVNLLYATTNYGSLKTSSINYQPMFISADEVVKCFKSFFRKNSSGDRANEELYMQPDFAEDLFNKIDNFMPLPSYLKWLVKTTKVNAPGCSSSVYTHPLHQVLRTWGGARTIVILTCQCQYKVAVDREMDQGLMSMPSENSTCHYGDSPKHVGFYKYNAAIHSNGTPIGPPPPLPNTKRSFGEACSNPSDCDRSLHVDCRNGMCDCMADLIPKNVDQTSLAVGLMHKRGCVTGPETRCDREDLGDDVECFEGGSCLFLLFSVKCHECTGGTRQQPCFPATSPGPPAVTEKACGGINEWNCFGSFDTGNNDVLLTLGCEQVQKGVSCDSVTTGSKKCYCDTDLCAPDASSPIATPNTTTTLSPIIPPPPPITKRSFGEACSNPSDCDRSLHVECRNGMCDCMSDLIPKNVDQTFLADGLMHKRRRVIAPETHCDRTELGDDVKCLEGGSCIPINGRKYCRWTEGGLFISPDRIEEIKCLYGDGSDSGSAGTQGLSIYGVLVLAISMRTFKFE